MNESAGSSKGVLVVDDDQQMRETLSDLLSLEGYEVACAENGQHGLEVLRGGFKPVVIILDLMMPVMNGLEFRMQQLADPALAEIPVVVLSAGTLWGAEPSVDVFIKKPMGATELLQVIRRLERANAAGRN